MSKIPSISGKKAKKAFEKLGFQEVRNSGSHAILKKDGLDHLVSLPIHAGHDVKKGLLLSQIKSAGFTVQEFLDAL